MQQPGRLIGLGVGPGDPELITVKALRLLREAPVVAYFVAKGKKGNAFGIIEAHLQSAQTLMPLVYPVTTEVLEAPLSYEQVISDFYDSAAQDLALHLDAGRDVACVLVGYAVIAGLAADPGDVATQQAHVLGEVVEIAAQGHLGHFQQRSHFPQVDGILVLQSLLDKLESLGFFTVHAYSRD